MTTLASLAHRSNVFLTQVYFRDIFSGAVVKEVLQTGKLPLWQARVNDFILISNAFPMHTSLRKSPGVNHCVSSQVTLHVSAAAS